MIILTSSVSSVADHIYKNYLESQGFKSVLFVDTAAEPEVADGEDDWLQADLLSLIAQGYEVDRYSVTNKTKEEIGVKIDEYDIFYMCGGNTAYLLDQLKKTDSFDLIIDKVLSGKPYIGTSAGSIIAGPVIPQYLSEEKPHLSDYTGFGFVNFVVVPHWGTEAFKNEYLGRRLEIAYKEDQPPFILLNDKQYVYVDDSGCIKVVEG